MPPIRPTPSSTSKPKPTLTTLKPKPTLRQKRQFQRLAAAQLNLRVCTDIDSGVDTVVEGDVAQEEKEEYQGGKKLTLAEEMVAVGAGRGRGGSVMGRGLGRGGRGEPKVAFDVEMDVGDMAMDVDVDMEADMDMAWTATPRPTGTEKKKFFISDEDDSDLTPTPQIELHLQDKHEIVPGLFVSLSSSIPSVLPTSVLREYTHIVRVSSSSARHSWTERDDKNGVDILNLTIPPPPPSHSQKQNPFSASPHPGAPGVTSLTLEQLLHARDSLSLSLPYYSLHNPPPTTTTPLTHPSPANLLIIAPTHIDALSIVVAYLAFCSGEHAFTVVQYIDEDGSVPRVWRGVFEVDWTLSFGGRERWYGEGAEFVEWAARLDG